MDSNSRHSVPHKPYNPNAPKIVINSLDEIPAFKDECEEVEFWDPHEFSDELWDALPPVPDDELPPVRARTRPTHAERAYDGDEPPVVTPPTSEPAHRRANQSDGP